jgi:hypothetical protein
MTFTLHPDITKVVRKTAKEEGLSFSVVADEAFFCRIQGHGKDLIDSTRLASPQLSQKVFGQETTIAEVFQWLSITPFYDKTPYTTSHRIRPVLLEVTGQRLYL